MYAMVATRPDLAFAVSIVNRFMLKPDPMHWMAVKRIMQYLKGTLDMRLCIGDKHINFKAYSDADWSGDVKNCMRFFFLLKRGPCRGIANVNKR